MWGVGGQRRLWLFKNLIFLLNLCDFGQMMVNVL